MRSNFILRPPFFLLAVCLAYGNAAAHLILEDGFAGDSLDGNVWTSGGQWNPSVVVDNGALALGNHTTAHFSYARTVEDGFNFHENEYTVTVGLASFDEPDWSNAEQPYSNMEYYFAIGPAENRSDVNSSDISRHGFSFNLRWRRDNGLDITTRSNIGVPTQSLSEVPATVQFSVDSTSFRLELLDAGGNLLYSESGPHGIAAGTVSSYNFLLMHQAGFSMQVGGATTRHYGVVDSVVIESASEPGPPRTPSGFDAVSGNERVTLNWHPVSGADAYNVKRAVTGGVLEVIATVSSRNYIDEDVLNDVTYDYAVSAVSDEYGEGEDSPVVSVTPRSMDVFEYVHLEEDFPGTSLDGSVWTSGGQWGPTISVANGTLTVGNQGNSWFAYARTASGHYDFHNGRYGVTIDLAAFAEPDWSAATAAYTNAELYFSMGPAENRSDVNSSDTSRTGFSFNLRWQRDNGLDLTTRSNVGVASAQLSEVPARVYFALDSVNFTLALLDASGETLHTDEGAHGIGPLDSYHFMIMHQMGGFSSPPFSSGVIESVTIEGSTEPPDPPPAGPFITVHPRDITVVETQIPAFMTIAEGEGELSYQWFRDGEPIEGADEDWYFPPFASADDHGARFHVEVSDSRGTTASESGHIYLSEYSAREEMERPDAALADYHIDPVNGSDSSGDGSAAAPFRTFDKVLPLLTGGEIVLFHEGEYPRIQITSNLASVPFTDWVTLLAAPGAKPRIDSLRIIGTAETPLISRNGGTDFRVRLIGMHIVDGVRIEQANYVRLEECLLTRRGPFNNTAANLEKSAVRIESARSVTIEDCEITETAHGIQGPTNDLVIRRTHIHYIAHDAIRIWGCDVVLIEDCLIHNLDDGYFDDHPLSMHTDGIQIYRAGHHRQNLMDNNSNLTVRNNRFFHISNMGIMVEGDLGMMHNWVFENNVFGPSGGFLIHIKRPVHGFVFRHNSIVYVENDTYESRYRTRTVRSYAVALPARPESSEVYVYNNIFHGPAPRPDGAWTEFSIASAFTEVYENNLFYMRTAMHWDIGANPVIVDDSPFANPTAYDGILKPGSAAIAAGSTFDPIGFDMTGRPRRMVPDIGAREFFDESDLEPPSIPTNPVATATHASVDLSWGASTDNVAVAGYLVFRDGHFVGQSRETRFRDFPLNEGTAYTYRVAAFDTAGNQSERGDPLQVTTDERPENIAMGRPVSVSSAQQEHPGVNAVDGDPDTSWRNTGRGPHWLLVSLDGPYEIIGADLLMESPIPPNMVLQVSRDGTWVDIAGSEIPDGGTPPFVMIFDEPVVTDHIRFTVNDTIGVATLNDFRVYGDPADIEVPQWAGFTAVSGEPDQIDTGGWMGTLSIGRKPWLWSFGMTKWIFGPDPGPDSGGAWLWFHDDPSEPDPSDSMDLQWGESAAESGWIDTGEFMGKIYMTELPWVWSDSLSCWIYTPVEGITETGVWGFSPQPVH